MASVMFPDFLGAIGKASAIEANQAQRDWMDEDRAAKKAAGALVPQALGGDREALNRIGSMHPDTAMKIAPLLERMDAGRRAKVKEDSDYITQSGMAILSAPPEQQPQLYARVRAEAEASGRNVSNWPTTYDPGWVKFNVDKARPFADYFSNQGGGFDLVPSGGGGAAPPATGGGGVNSFNIGNVRPVGGGPNSGFQQPASLDDGIRLAVNNVKAYPAKFNNGQPMTLVQIGQRWAPKGDGANDPNQWAINVASIGGLDPNQPLDLNDPMTAAKFARGVHGAEHGANKVLPPERYAQAITGGAAPPGIAQGDTAPPADASGNPIPTSDGGAVPREAMGMITPNLPPGTSLGKNRKTGQYIVQEGHFVVYDDRTRNPVGLIPIPKAPGVGQIPIGYELNPNGSGLRPIAGGPADPRTAQALADAKRKADEKTIPQSVTKGVQENLDNLKEVDRALGMLTKTPGSVGGPGSILAANIPGAGLIQNWIDKDGTDVRAKIANIGSLIVHQRSGAAVTAAEFPRLKPFIPTISDDPATVKKKLEQFKMVYEEIIRDTLEYYGPENGFRPYTPATNYINRDQTPAAPPAAATPPPPAAPQPAPVPQQPAPQTPSPAERGRSQFDLKKKYGLE